MPTGVPPTSAPAGSVSTSGSPSALGSTSRHSSDRVARSDLSMPWISCSSSSSTRGLCLVLRPDAESLLSVTTASCASSCRSLPVQGAGFVHRRPAALLALHLVLRVVRARADRPPGSLGVLRDLPRDGALRRSAVAVPGDVVTLLQVVGHGSSSARSGGRPAPARPRHQAHITRKEPGLTPESHGSGR